MEHDAAEGRRALPLSHRGQETDAIVAAVTAAVGKQMTLVLALAGVIPLRRREMNAVERYQLAEELRSLADKIDPQWDESDGVD
ncbi:MAG TPA: hypothetical protein VHE30_01455 [Polyangiaceae bacterium]|nr:hypothetical protein [Polyangiaceae bacterium]